MKIGRKQWRQVVALARDEGYEGTAADVDAVKSYLTDEAMIGKLTIDGKAAEVKALQVETSEDQMQVLVTQVEDEAEEEAPPDESAPAPPAQNNINLDDPKVKQRLRQIVSEMGTNQGHRPHNPAADVKNLGTVEDRRFMDRAKSGRTALKEPWKAKSFALMVAAGGLRAKGQHKLADQKEAELAKLAEYHGYGSKAMATTPGSAGGALTEEMFEPELIRLVEEYGAVSRLMSIRSTEDLAVTIKRRSGGVTVYHPDENTAITESSPTYENVQLQMKRAAVLSQASSDVMRYTTPEAGDLIAEEHALAIAQYMDFSVLGGDGSGGPSGFDQTTLPNSKGLYEEFGRTTVGTTGHKVTGGDTPKAHDETHLADMLSRLAVRARQGAVIIGSPEKLAMTFDRLGRAKGGVDMSQFSSFGMVKTWAGIPLIEHFGDVEGSDVTGAGGDQIDFIYVNLDMAGKIYRKSGMEFDTSDQRYFDQDAIAFRTVIRWNFLWHDIGSTTATDFQPAVALYQT